MKFSPTAVFFLLLTCGFRCFSSETKDVLNNIENSYSGINDISFNFTQKLTIKISGETETISGNAAFKKPDKFRITNKKPREQTIVCDGKKMYLYSKKLNQVTVEEPGSQGQMLPRQFFDFSSVISDLTGGYDISIEKEDTDYFILSCTPKGEKRIPESASNNSKMKLWISKEKYLLKQMETSTDATVTEISVSKIKTNNNIGESLFKFKIPKGADVVTPR